VFWELVFVVSAAFSYVAAMPSFSFGAVIDQLFACYGLITGMLEI
jgi:hypothetical protein